MSFITSEAALWRPTALCLRPGVCPALLNWSWRLVTVPSFSFSSDLIMRIIKMMMMIMMIRIIMRGTTIRWCKLTAGTGSSSPTLHMTLQVWKARVVDCHSLSGPRQAGMVWWKIEFYWIQACSLLQVTNHTVQVGNNTSAIYALFSMSYCRKALQGTLIVSKHFKKDVDKLRLTQDVYHQLCLSFQSDFLVARGDLYC